MLPPSDRRRRKLSRQLTTQFCEALSHCHSFMDYVILEEALANVHGYFKRKRTGGLIDSDQIEIFNQQQDEA